MSLAIRRRRGQKIKIGENIVITIGEIRGDIVQVVLDAPREIRIERVEERNSNDNANDTGAASRQ